MENAPFWACKALNDGDIGFAVTLMEGFARDARANGTAFDGTWQDEICFLNEQLPELATDWPMIFPGTQLVERGRGDQEALDSIVFVLTSQFAEGPMVTVLQQDGDLRDIDITPVSGDGFMEAGQ